MAGTQKNHVVTPKKDSVKVLKMPDNSTKPMSKEDAAAKKKYGPKSWNNGYTN